MADNLTDEAERLVLDWLNGAVVTQPVAPLKVRLTSTTPTDSAAGTEVTGDVYTPQDAGLGVAATTAGVSKITNAATVTFTAIDSAASRSVAGVEIWDSGGTPRRIAHGVPTGAPVSVAAGEACVFNPGDLSLTLG